MLVSKVSAVYVPLEISTHSLISALSWANKIKLFSAKSNYCCAVTIEIIIMESETSMSRLGHVKQNYSAGPAWAADSI